ncbi:tail completion protein gp17 [Sphingobium sp. LSP13-1-1.1]|uniref:tail completion protein gp17 n=1 Tax=Sphingobium sp. LSP13-1-1.1 TaxID=3135234 RepID=UPI00343EA0F0
MRVDLITRLRASEPISAIIGDRVYWDKRKVGEGFPAIVLYKISPGRTYTFKGATGLQSARVQFDCMAQEVRDFDPLFKAVRDEMERTVTIGETEFGMSFLDSERDMPTVDVAGIGPVGGVSADFIVWWQST